MHPHRSIDFSLVLSLAICCLAFTGSQAQTFQTRNVTLLSHLDLYGEYTNDAPYIHTDGREYVAIGTRFGTSIVRLTNPANPVEVGFIPGASSLTRDADQYQTYIYVVSSITRFVDTGIQIISMADPDHPVLVKTVHGSVETAENITIDRSRALMFTSETNVFTAPNGGLHILSLADPLNPVELSANESYEVHDFEPFGNIGFASDISTGTMHVIDISNPSAPSEIASVATGEAVHSFGLAPGGRFLYTTDENSLSPVGGLVSIYDIQNLPQISLVSKLNLVPFATAHYVRVLGSLAFFAYYTGGVRVWDISNPSWPAEAGFLDTWSGDDLTADGVYDMSPYYPSGIATATDRELGLFVFRAGSNYGIVRGTVMVGKNPLVGATVRALPGGPSTVTDPAGRYALAPAPGGVTIEASKFGYGTSTSAVSVAQGSDQTVNFTSSKLQTGTVRGTVTRASDGTGIEAVEVTGVGTPLGVSTSSRGAYAIMEVPADALTIHAERPGFVPRTAATVVPAKGTSTVDFTLPAATFYDDAEVDRGWTLGAPDDDATEGRWVRAVPVGNVDENGFPEQPGRDHSPSPGNTCFVTGNDVMPGNPFFGDVDRGKTTLISPPLAMSGVADPRIVFWRWFYTNNIFAGPRANPFITDLSNDNGASWVRADSVRGLHNSWERVEIRVTDYFPSPGTVRVRFIARDLLTGGSIIEAAIDDIEFYSGTAASSAAVAVTEAPGSEAPAVEITPIGARGDSRSFRLRLRQTGRVEVRLFDVSGRLARTLANQSMEAGAHTLTWDERTETGARAARGIYLLRVSASGSVASAKLVLLR